MARTIAVVGSRRFPTPKASVDWFLERFEQQSVIVRTGDAPGIDAAARRWAMVHGKHVDVVTADWGGPRRKMAGKDRNWDIVRDADEVIAFWDGESNGTAHSIAAAVRLHVPVTIHMAGDS